MKRWQRIQLAAIALLVFPMTGCQTLNTAKGWLAKKSPRGLGQRADQNRSPDDSFDPMGRRAGDRVLLEDLAPSQIGTTLRSKGFAGTDQETAQKHFQSGQDFYRQGTEAKRAEPNSNQQFELFTQAAAQFKLAASRWPDSSMEEDALFYEGESLFFANRYVQSNRTFENLLQKYAGTRYLDRSEALRFSIAQYWLQLADADSRVKFNDPKRPKSGLKTEGRRILHLIRLDDPTGKLADDATLALADAYFKDNLFQDAADTYEDLRRNYPGSKHQFHAHMLELKARLQAYRGPSYDDEPLVKADQLMKTILRQFPEQAREEKEYLAQEASTIRTQLASRDVGMARYYENRGENRAASLTYQQVADKYQDTNFSDQVQTQIAELENKPPMPKQHGKWLVDLFPDPEAQRPVIVAGDNERRILR